MKFHKVLLLLTVLLLCLSGCQNGNPPHTSGRTMVDGAGRTVSLPDQVERVVCVGVGALRYTCYMGAQQRVIGVERHETEQTLDRLYNYVNHTHFSTLPVIGENGNPWPESILSVAPQVIVLSAYAAADAEELQAKTGIPVVVVPGSDSLLDEKAYETLRLLGILYGLEERTTELSAFLRETQVELAQRTAGQSSPSVYVCGLSFQGAHGFEGTEAGYGPLLLIGAHNLADTVGIPGAFDVDLEQVLVWDPDVIFVDFNGMGLIEQHRSAHPDFYRSLTAVQEGRVYTQISFRSFAVNLDTALANAWYAASVLYPEQFSDVDPEDKAGEIFTILLGTNPYPALKEAGYAFRPIQLL